METVVKSISPILINGEHESFTGQYGTLYKFRIAFDNGVEAVCNGKNTTPTFQPGDKVSYTITKEGNSSKGYLPQVKVEKIKVDGGGYKGGSSGGFKPKTAKEQHTISRQVAMECAIDYHSNVATKITKEDQIVGKTAISFEKWLMTKTEGMMASNALRRAVQYVKLLIITEEEVLKKADDLYAFYEKAE